MEERGPAGVISTFYALTLAVPPPDAPVSLPTTSIFYLLFRCRWNAVFATSYPRCRPRASRLDNTVGRVEFIV
ncbi:hypothetical protein XELAEV_18013734mg [Xenopus laevis]|uniref:Uncharacterized protein n=1 Tax=Xenopus laevis TaxID=8355 RepID=A0A974DQF9_XENLA|nr:hypothetical protein XELAEV_18013734mg [Xenopus laevis]